MADKHIADGEVAFKAVCSTPDCCVVGLVTVPFDSFQTLDRKRLYASTVFARGFSVLNVGSVIAGSQSNAGSGVKSGTSQGSGDCIILSGSPTVNVEGKPVARHDSDVGINNMNCAGKLHTLLSPPIVAVKDNALPCNNPPVSSSVLEELKALKESMKQDLLASVRNAVDFSDSIHSGDACARGLIDKLQPGSIDGAGSTGEVLNASGEIVAGVGRGIVGLAWDAVSGTDSLLNSGVQSALNLPQTSLDALILAENIRLGNVCAAGMWQDTKKMFAAAKKAAADEWEKASHASLGEQAEAATKIAGLIGLFFVGAGEVKLAEPAGGVSEIAGTGEVGGVANSAGRTEESVRVVMPVDNTGVIIAKARAFGRSMSERRKALLRDAKDPNSGLTEEQRKFILDNNGYKVPHGIEVSHEVPLYTADTIEGKQALDISENMKTQAKDAHRARHKVCGDQYHDFPR